MKKIILLLSSILIFFCFDVFAAPSITGVSGTLTDGSSMTITSGANDFGSKSPAAPLKWDDFENGTVGETVHHGWTVSSPGGSVVPVYANTQQRTANDVGIINVYTIISGGQWASNIIWSPVHPSDIQKIYISLWKYDIISGRVNYKPWRVYGDAGGTYSLPSFNCADFSDQNLTMGVVNVNGDGGGGDNAHRAYGTAHLPASQWYRQEGYIYAGTQGGQDGYCWVWVNAIEQILYTDATLGDGSTFLADGSRFDKIYIGHYADATSLETWIDDVYIDITCARVEIGNASTWATCTHREIQIPSAWAAGELTATVNRGSFGASETVWLYVVDSDGNVNADGKSVQFGETYGNSSTYNESIGLSSKGFYSQHLRGAGVKMEVQ
jgi:hypothetical protein